MKRILVIRGGAIGDFVLTLPAIKLLREGFPNARIEILGYKHIVALAENRFYAQAVRSIEYGALASFFARGADLPNELSDYFKSFDLIVSYLFDPDRIFEQNLMRAGAEIILACSPKIQHEAHATLQLARPLEQLDLSLGDLVAPKLFPTSADRNVALAFLSEQPTPIIALHPGSGSTKKNWPIDRWQKLSEWLVDDGHAASLLVVGGEADQQALELICSGGLGNKLIRRVENFPLPHLAAILEQCGFFVGHDSGISHIAAAVGTPCLLLFGPTDPRIWAPTNERVRVLRSPNESLEALTLAVVNESLASHFAVK